MNAVRWSETKRAVFLMACLVTGNFLYAAMMDTVDAMEALERSFFQASALFLYVSPWRSNNPKEIYG